MILRDLLSLVRSGKLSRRSFLEAAALAGVGVALAEEALEEVRVPLVASFLPAEPKVAMTVVNVGEDSASFFAAAYGRLTNGTAWPVANSGRPEPALAAGQSRQVLLAYQSDLPGEPLPLYGFVSATSPGMAVFVLRDIKVRPARGGMGTWRRA